MPESSDVISHWHYSVEGLSTSALDFYSSIEKALAAKQVPVVQSRVEWNEGGILSAKREYLRLGYGRLFFDISAFPYGTDYYFSSWLTRKKPSLAALVGCFGLAAPPILWVLCVSLAGVFYGTILAFVSLVITIAALGSQVGDESSEIGEMIVAIPYLGRVFERFFKPVTYYSEDTRIMFEETVHRAVLDVLAGVLTVNSMQPLTAEQSLADRGMAVR